MRSAIHRICAKGRQALPHFLFSEKLRKRKKIIIGSAALVFLVAAVLFVAHPASAQGLGTDVVNWGIRLLATIMVKLAVICIQITLFLLRFFMLIAGYNNYINAPVVILGWNMVRDVANMFFIVVLMVIAFGTILGLEQYEWKKTLVKLIIAALFVNFSNLILQLMIDAAQVFTITFLNAVAGSAGGNLIQMFNVEKIFNIAVGQGLQEGIAVEIFGAGVMSLVFAVIAMFTMGAYVVILLARMVVLWALIILSPLGFLFQALPQTKPYADEFWKEFTNHVLAAPVMVFFLWLAFSTFGGEGITSHLEFSHPLGGQAAVSGTEDITGQAPSVSINRAASWDNMANFAVAIAFLWMGIERVQKLGVRAGGLAQGAIDFGKKVATIASGYAAGRFLYERGLKPAAGGVIKHLPVIGTEKWKQRGKNEWESLKGWYYGQAIEPQKGLFGNTVGAVAGWSARQAISTEKRLAKTQKQAETRKKILWKRTGSEAGGILLPAVSGGRLGMSRSKMRDAQDRIEEGWLQAEELRSKAKDEEYHALGRKEVLSSPRYKAGAKLWSRAKYETEHGTMAERIAEHKFLAGIQDSDIKKLDSEARSKVLTGGRNIKRTYGATMSTTADASMKKKQIKAKKRMEKKQKEITNLEESVTSLETQIHDPKINDKKRAKMEKRLEESRGLLEAKRYAHEETQKKYQESARAAAGSWEQQFTPDKFFRAQSMAKVAADRVTAIEEGKQNRVLSSVYKAGLHLDAMAGSIAGGRFDDLLQEMDFTLDDKTRNQLAEAIRGGDKDLAQRFADAAAASNDEKGEGKWRQVVEDIDNGAVQAWQYATSKGEAGDISRGYRLAHSDILAEGEQRAVHDDRGLPTPKNAFADLVEESSKNLNAMAIGQFVEAFGNVMVRYSEKTEAGEVSDADRAQLMALFMRGFDRAWLDDAIYSVMDNKEAAEKIGKPFGWKDTAFTPDKIRDIQMFMASSGDVNFVKDHSVISRIMESAELDLKMDSKDAIAALKGEKDFNGDIEVAVRQSLANEHISWNDDQWNTFREIQGKGGKDRTERWLDVQRNHQAEMEYLGNLRSDAIKGGHMENAGWSLSKQVSDRESLYIGGGVRQAQNHVTGDVKKTDVRLRSAFHPHTVARIMTEKFGQSMLMIDEKLLSIVRNGIDDMRTWGNTTPRWINHMLGFSAKDETKDFKDESGFLRLGASKDVQNAWKAFFKENHNVDVFDGLNEEEIERKTGELILHNVIMPQLEINQKDFLLTAAKVTGIDGPDALNLGKMKIKIAGMEITNINQLIDAVNDGTVGAGVDWNTGQISGRGQAKTGKERVFNYETKGREAAQAERARAELEQQGGG